MKLPRSFVCLAVLCCVAPAARAAAESSGEELRWTGWLGPKRDGWVDGFRAPAPWPEQLRKVWQVEVGTGYGPSLVADGRVYLHARQDEEEVVWCLDVRTGRVRWRSSDPTPFEIGAGGEYHGKGPKSSPTLADGRLFTMSIMGVLTAWDADSGRRLWRRDFGSRFKQGRPRWGVAGSPIVAGDRIVAHFGTDGQGALIALDTATGEEVWSQGKDGPSYSSPLFVEIQGVPQIIDWNERALFGVDSRSGRLLWQYPHPQDFSDQNMPTPVYHKGRVLLGAENRGIRGLEPRMEGGAWTVQEQWRQQRVALNMSSAVMNGDLLYGLSHYRLGQFFCLDPKTGKVLWEGPGRTGEHATFLSAPGHVVALVNDGELQVFEASRERFEKVASYRVAESATWAPPVLLRRGILVKDVETLALWSFEAGRTRSPSR